jgi:3-phytase
MFVSCHSNSEQTIEPFAVTDPVRYDSEDPAIWINRTNPAESLVLATDKNKDGALYVFDLTGKMIQEKIIRGLARPNNVDVGYGFSLNGNSIDIAVVTERLENRIRVFLLPDMIPIDNGGIPVFESEEQNAPMGIALYKRPWDGSMFAVVSRKEGPTDGTYLWQYLLEEGTEGYVAGRKVREFGKWSGHQEIEAVAVDHELGYIYYSDEGIGVRKYHADPEASDADKELALFATSGFKEDHEGISIWNTGETEGFIIVSDQAAGKLRLYPKNGKNTNEPHEHELLAVVRTQAKETDGIAAAADLVTADYPCGIIVVMSDDKTYHYYSLKDILDH